MVIARAQGRVLSYVLKPQFQDSGRYCYLPQEGGADIRRWLCSLGDKSSGSNEVEGEAVK